MDIRSISNNLPQYRFDSSVSNLRTKIDVLQSELVTGRKNDVATNLGIRANIAYTLRQNISTSETFQFNIIKAQTTLSSIDLALQSAGEGLDQVLSSAIDARNGSITQGELAEVARHALKDLTNQLSVQQGGEFLFSGLNIDTKPINAYKTIPASAAQIQFSQGFSNHFGFAPNDPSVSTITASQIQDYLNSTFEQDFQNPAWGANWSNASLESKHIRISENDQIDLPNIENTSATRKLAQAYTILMELNDPNISNATYNQILDYALSQMGTAQEDINTARAKIGRQTASTSSVERLSEEKIIIMRTQLDRLEGVDQYQISEELNRARIQLEIAYNLTARTQELFLARYL